MDIRNRGPYTILVPEVGKTKLMGIGMSCAVKRKDFFVSKLCQVLVILWSGAHYTIMFLLYIYAKNSWTGLNLLRMTVCEHLHINKRIEYQQINNYSTGANVRTKTNLFPLMRRRICYRHLRCWELPRNDAIQLRSLNFLCRGWMI